MRVDVAEILKKSRLDKIYESNGKLKLLLNIFALDSAERRVSRNETRRYICKAIFTAFILGALIFASFDYKLKNIFNDLNLSITITDSIQMIYDYFQYIIDLIVVYKYGRETSQTYFKQYEYFDKDLNFTYYKDIKCHVTVLTWIILSLFLVSSTIDYMGWYMSYGAFVPFIYSITYVCLLLKVLTNLDLTTQVINVAYRLRVIGDWIQGYYECCVCKSSELSAKSGLEDPVKNKNWFYADGHDKISQKTKTSDRHPSRRASNNFHEIKVLSKCYLLLNEQCTFIRKFYGIRVLIQTLSLLIDMVRFFNVGVRIAIKTQKTPYNAGYFTVATCLAQFSFCGVLITSLVYQCEQAYRQVERIQALIDHTFINKEPDAALRTSLIELRDLINRRPISFNMANCFQLSFSFLISTASVVVTYSIILLQCI